MKAVRKALALAAGVFMAGGARAEAIELTFAVGNLTQSVSQWGGPAVPVALSGPASFDITVRFELEQPLPGGGYDPEQGQMTGLRFRQVAISPPFYNSDGPYLDVLQPSFTAELEWPSWYVGQAAFDATAWLGIAEPGETVQRAISYSSELHLPSLPVLYFSDGTPAVAGMLQSRVGDTEASGFSGRYTVSTRERSSPDDDWRPQSSQTVQWRGSLTLKSVSAVPEPQTLLLSAMGLLAAAVAARRVPAVGRDLA